MDREPEESRGGEEGMNMSTRGLLLMSLFSLLFYLIIALTLLHFFHEGELSGLFDHGYSTVMQIGIGGISGCAAAGVIIFFSGRSPMAEVLDDFAVFRVLANTEFSHFDRIQVSFFAGVGEEILFRGAIQPLLGIWVTSVLFIAIHGYISFRSAGHILFTLLLFALSMMLGLLFEFAGLVAAMSAHAVYDLIMLWWVKGIGGDKSEQISTSIDHN